MKIPYVGLKRQQENIKDEIIEAISKVLDHSFFILGDEVIQFEEKMGKYCQVNHTIGLNSGTDALFLALKCLGIGKGDEVITVPNSFLASTSSIVVSEAKPVFVDVKEDMNINPDLIESAITENTKAILPVHLTGKPVDMKNILKIAKDHDIFVIEDAAQAIGAEINGKRVGSFGDVNCFSLHPLKNLNACGDAGAITTNDEKIYNQLLQLRNIGLKNRDEADIWGYNSRLDTIQAAILNVKFKYLDSWIKKRRENAKFYSNQLKDIVKVPSENPGEKSVYHTYIIQTDKRDKLKKYLAENGIDSKIHYPIPIHLQKAAAQLNYKKGDFPITEKLTETILTLPIYENLTDIELNYIVEKIKYFFNKN